MTKSEKQQWEQVRAKGFVSYLLRRGLLFYGLGFGILMTLTNVFIFHEAIAPVGSSLIRFAHYVFEFGAFMGIVEWCFHQYDYKRPDANDDPAKPESK